MGTVTDRYNVTQYLPEGLSFSVSQTADGLEFNDGTIKIGLYNDAGERIEQTKVSFQATQGEKDALLSHLALRRTDFEAAEGLTLLPLPE